MIVESLYEVLTELDANGIDFYIGYVDSGICMTCPIHDVRKGKYPHTYSFCIIGADGTVVRTLKNIHIDGLTFNNVPVPNNWTSYFTIRLENITSYDVILKLLNKYRRRD